jgi:hypothetical protein
MLDKLSKSIRRGFTKILLSCPCLIGDNSEQLREGTALELPYWLVATLSVKYVSKSSTMVSTDRPLTSHTLYFSLLILGMRRDIIDLTLPRPYTARVRNALAASSAAVNLRNLGGGGGMFYTGGHRLNLL